MLKKKYKRTFPQLFLTTVAGLSAQTFAFQPLITDDTGTQGAGGNQLEFSYTLDRVRSNGETEQIHTVPAAYTRGLTETIDLFIGTSYAWIRPAAQGNNASGFGNPSLGIKWRFYENKETKTSVAIKPEIVLPVSASRERTGLGTGKISGNLTFIVTQEVPFGAIHFNAGMGRDRFRSADENPDTTYKRASLAPVWDLNEQWKLGLDLGVESARADGHVVISKFAGLGAIYSPSKNIDFALGFFRTADNETPSSTTHSATAGVTWRF